MVGHWNTGADPICKPHCHVDGASTVTGVSMMPLATHLAAPNALRSLNGFGFSRTQTPIGRIINRSAHNSNRGAVLAAQFALSRACWLV